MKHRAVTSLQGDLSLKRSKQSVSLVILAALFGIILVLVSLHLSLQYLNLEVFNEKQGQVFELSNRFDLDDEASVPSWLSQFQFLLLGAGALLAAKLSKQKAKKYLWGFIALVGLLASIDEVATLHEFGLQSIHNLLFLDTSPTRSANAWLVILPFVLLVAGLILWQMVRHVPKRTLVIFMGSMAVFLIGAVGIDIITSAAEANTFMHQGILVGAEEAFELLSVAVAIYAVADYLERNHRTALREAIARLKA